MALLSRLRSTLRPRDVLLLNICRSCHLSDALPRGAFSAAPLPCVAPRWGTSSSHTHTRTHAHVHSRATDSISSSRATAARGVVATAPRAPNGCARFRCSGARCAAQESPLPRQPFGAAPTQEMRTRSLTHSLSLRVCFLSLRLAPTSTRTRRVPQITVRLILRCVCPLLR